MSDSISQIQEELIQIEIAIQLDQGKSTSEVADNFGVQISFVKNIAKKVRSEESKIKKRKTRRFSESEKTLLVKRIELGDALEDIALEEGITQNTIRRWCKSQGVVIPREVDEISITERMEIYDLLEELNIGEIMEAYNISSRAIEEIQEPLHSNLDVSTLSYLFELLRERKKDSDKMLSKIAKKAGIEIPSSSIASYRKRLKKLDLI